MEQILKRISNKSSTFIDFKKNGVRMEDIQNPHTQHNTSAVFAFWSQKPNPKNTKTTKNFFFVSQLPKNESRSLYNVYVYVCICVCVCVYFKGITGLGLGLYLYS